MTFERAGRVGRGTGRGDDRAQDIDHGLTPGKRTLTEHLPAADPRASAVSTAEQLAAIADAVHQIEHTVVPQWYAAVDHLDPAAVGVAGAFAMIQWSRILAAEGRLGAQQAAVALPVIKLARVQLGKLGLRHAPGAVLTLTAPNVEGDPVTFIHARVDQAQMCIGRLKYVLGLASSDSHGVRTLDDAAKGKVLIVLNGLDPIEVRWLEAQCGRFGLSLRMQRDEQGLIADRLKHAQDQADVSAKAQREVDPLVAERLSKDVDYLIELCNDRAGESSYVAVLRKHAPNERALLLTIAKQRNVLFNMVEIAGSSDAGALIAAIREAPGYSTFAADRSRATVIDTNLYRAAGAIGTEMVRQAPGAITRSAAGAVDSFSSIPIIGRITHFVADKLRDVSDAAYDGMGASKEWRDGANLVSELSGGLGATAVTMNVSAAAKGAQAVKTVADVADSGMTIANVIEEVRGLVEAAEDVSAAWKLIDEVGIQLAAAVIDIGGGALIGAGQQRERAIDSLSGLIDVYLKRLEPAESGGEGHEGLGHHIKAMILSMLGAALKELKNALLKAAKLNEPVDVREVTRATLAGALAGAPLALKNQVNGYLQRFIVGAATKILQRNHPAMVELLRTVGEKPIKRLIELTEERLKVDDKLVHAFESVIALLDGGHAEHAEHDAHGPHGPHGQGHGLAVRP